MTPERPASSKTLGNREPRVYLAGPEVFLRNAKQIGERKKALCADYAFRGVPPLDGDVEFPKGDRRKAGLRISSANENLIRGCEFLIANITPFRGPSADVGTVYEMGFARASGLTIFAYTNVADSFAERTLTTFQDSITRGKDGKLRDWNDMAVEEFGLVDNLMLDGSVVSSGGMLVIENAPAGERFTFLGGFEKCLRHARQVILNKKRSDRHS